MVKKQEKIKSFGAILVTVSMICLFASLYLTSPAIQEAGMEVAIGWGFMALMAFLGWLKIVDETGFGKEDRQT